MLLGLPCRELGLYVLSGETTGRALYESSAGVDIGRICQKIRLGWILLILAFGLGLLLVQRTIQEASGYAHEGHEHCSLHSGGVTD